MYYNLPLQSDFFFICGLIELSSKLIETFSLRAVIFWNNRRNPENFSNSTDSSNKINLILFQNEMSPSSKFKRITNSRYEMYLVSRQNACHVILTWLILIFCYFLKVFNEYFRSWSGLVKNSAFWKQHNCVYSSE